MENFKLVTDHRAAAERFLAEVGTDAVRYYDVPSFQSSIVPSVYPPRFMQGCTSMTVAVSGSQAEGLNWMVFCPHRVDKDKKADGLVYDIDPMVLTFDQALRPSKVAVVGYHLTFPGRVTPIPGFRVADHPTSVAALRSQIVTGLAPVQQCSPQVQEALGFMANYYRKNDFA